LAWTNKQLKIM